VNTKNSFNGSRVIACRDVDIPTDYHGEPNWLVRELSLAREEARFFKVVVKMLPEHMASHPTK
jgi:hypothetical protein